MIKTTREDYYDLNTDGSMDLDKVNQFLEQLQDQYKDGKEKNNDKDEEEEKDGE